jgi:hydroxymethylpyrimidine/phosphomethylpyrimidine kinase
MVNVPQVMCIAGEDSTGFAGLDQDVRTIRALGCLPVPLCTAKTRQSSDSPHKVAVAEPEVVLRGIQERLAAAPIASVKIGMLGNRTMVEAVMTGLVDYGGPIVLDPVLKASSGLVLLEKSAWPTLKQFVERCALVTPNLPEFRQLGGDAWLEELGVPALLKGGHGETDLLVDRLIWPDGRSFQKSHLRLSLANSRGTGCALSSAIACNLALGLDLQDAVSNGIQWLQSTFRSQELP